MTMLGGVPGPKEEIQTAVCANKEIKYESITVTISITITLIRNYSDQVTN